MATDLLGRSLADVGRRFGINFLDDPEPSSPSTTPPIGPSTPTDATEETCIRSQTMLRSCLETVLRQAHPTIVPRIHLQLPRRLFLREPTLEEGLATLDVSDMPKFRMTQFITALETELIRNRACVALQNATLETRERLLLQLRWLPLPTATRLCPLQTVPANGAEKRSSPTTPEEEPLKRHTASIRATQEVEADNVDAVRELRVPGSVELFHARVIQILHALFGRDEDDTSLERSDDHHTMKMRIPIPILISIADWKAASLLVDEHCGPESDLYFRAVPEGTGAVFVEWKL